MNGLDDMQFEVDQAIAEIADSASVTVSKSGQTFIMSQPYFSFLVKVPYFRRLTRAEKAEVKRIFHQVNVNFIAQQVQYHYDNDREKKNGYSYVVDNLRYILSLPEPDDESLFVKFLMIASLGKMKFLSKRNIDLIFVERETVMKRALSEEGACVPLEEILNFFDKVTITHTRILYPKSAEGLYYLGITFLRWARTGNMSLREVIMRQEVFGVELPPMGDLPMSVSVNMFIRSFFEKCSRLSNNGSFDPVKVLCDKRQSDGLIDATVEDVEDYLSFFRWESGLVGNGKRSVCSFSDFKEGFHLEKEKFSVLYAGVYADFPLREGDDEGNDNLLSLQKEGFFLFCLLKGDEAKFSDLFNAILENVGTFNAMTSEQTYDFLNMVREYGECDYLIPVSLLSGLHGLDEVFVD